MSGGNLHEGGETPVIFSADGRAAVLAGELPAYFSGAAELAACAFKALGQGEVLAFSLLAPDGGEMREINKESRGIDKITDVLSFPSLSGVTAGERLERGRFPYEWDGSLNALFIGDILICPMALERQAGEIGNTPEQEFCYLLVHGLVHLLGYDHLTGIDKAAMRAAEKEILGAWTKSRLSAL